MRGIELPVWRKRNGFTQDTLRIALGVKSRQTIITWEKATEPLPRLVELALLALEKALTDAEDVIRAAAAWAIERIRQRTSSLKRG